MQRTFPRSRLPWVSPLPILILAFSHCVGAQGFKQIYVDPDCPMPGEAVTLRAVVNGAFQMVTGPLVATRDAATFKLVLPITNSTFNEVPPQYGIANFGTLPAGTYVVELYTRVQLTATTLGPEQFVTRATFEVSENPPPCEPRYIEALESGVVKGMVGESYERALAVRVVDAHGYPVPNAPVYWYRMQPPGEPYVLPQRPDAVGIAFGRTNGQGVLSIAAVANSHAGTFQYRAYFPYVELQPTAYFVLSNRPKPDTAPLFPVVEYEDGLRLHYFMTSNPVEMAKLDAQANQWRRTGGVFLAYGSSAANRPAEAVSVCRFYGLPEAGIDSHFFTASTDECRAVEENFGSKWLLETEAAFGVLLPDLHTGSCPPDSLPVHRYYNNRPDANHRYGTGLLALLAPSYFMATGPWIPEGYGPDAVAMCAPR